MTSASFTLRRVIIVTLVAATASAAALVRVGADGHAPPSETATFTEAKTVYKGLCDASAAIALSPTRFAVFNDEDNHLRVFALGNGAEAVPDQDLDLDVFLGTDVDKEADVEGAARIGDVVYWITSHGRNSSGEFQKRRLRLFATRLTTDASAPLQPEGTAYRDLLETFIEPVLKAEGFTAAPGVKVDATKAPEKPGSLNIEGLAASGNSLLIGFRNPHPRVAGAAHALVVELRNPDKLITGSPAAPEKGQVFRLDLGGRGVRSLEALPDAGGFAIVAGPSDDTGTFALYRWDGTQSSPPVQVKGVDFKGFTPEAMFVDQRAAGDTSKTVRLTVLSDDGGVKLTDGKECKAKPKTRWQTRLGSITLN
jgi:hypothetical protein